MRCGIAIASTKSGIPDTLFSWPANVNLPGQQWGGGIPNSNKTTRPNADTILNPEEFYEPGLNQKIAIREMGG